MTTELAAWKQDAGDAGRFIDYGPGRLGTAAGADVSDDQFVQCLADEEVARDGIG